MTPKELSLTLARIASKIDASENPSKSLVLKDLNRIIASFEVESADSHEAGVKHWLSAMALALASLGASQSETVQDAAFDAALQGSGLAWKAARKLADLSHVKKLPQLNTDGDVDRLTTQLIRMSGQGAVRDLLSEGLEIAKKKSIEQGKEYHYNLDEALTVLNFVADEVIEGGPESLTISGKTIRGRLVNGKRFVWDGTNLEEEFGQ